MGQFRKSNKTELFKDLVRLCPNGQPVHFSNWVTIYPNIDRVSDKELTITRRGKRIFLKTQGWEGDIANDIVGVQRYAGYNVSGDYTQQWYIGISSLSKCPVSSVTIYEKDPVEPEWRKQFRNKEQQ